MSPETVTLPDGRVRATATLIHFLLPAGESSAWHRVASDEVWLAHLGEVRLQLGGDRDAPWPARKSSSAPVPRRRARSWSPRVSGSARCPVTRTPWSSCLVSPGFDFADFELA